MQCFEFLYFNCFEYLHFNCISTGCFGELAGNGAGDKVIWWRNNRRSRISSNPFQERKTHNFIQRLSSEPLHRIQRQFHNFTAPTGTLTAHPTLSQLDHNYKFTTIKCGSATTPHCIWRILVDLKTVLLL